MHYVYLVIAILGEVVATSALKAADGFTKLGPSVVVVIGYTIALLFLSLTIRTMPVGIAYAICAVSTNPRFARPDWHRPYCAGRDCDQHDVEISHPLNCARSYRVSSLPWCKVIRFSTLPPRVPGS
jgi:Small Multidrug Resistance protein